MSDEEKDYKSLYEKTLKQRLRFANKINKQGELIKEMRNYISSDVSGISMYSRQLLEKNKGVRMTKDEVPCFNLRCCYFDKNFPVNCSGKKINGTSYTTCDTYLRTSKIIKDYHAKKCSECKKTIKCDCCGDPIKVGVCENCVPGIYDTLNPKCDTCTALACGDECDGMSHFTK